MVKKKQKKVKKGKKVDAGMAIVTGCLLLAKCFKCKVPLQFHGQWDTKEPVDGVGGVCPECGAENVVWFSSVDPKANVFAVTRTFNIRVALPVDKKKKKSKAKK